MSALLPLLASVPSTRSTTEHTHDRAHGSHSAHTSHAHGLRIDGSALMLLRVLISKLVVFQTLGHLVDQLQTLRHSSHRVGSSDVRVVSQVRFVKLSFLVNGNLGHDRFQLSHQLFVLSQLWLLFYDLEQELNSGSQEFDCVQSSCQVLGHHGLLGALVDRLVDMINRNSLRVSSSQLEVHLDEFLLFSDALEFEKEGWKLLLLKSLNRLRVHEQVHRVFCELLQRLVRNDIFSFRLVSHAGQLGRVPADTLHFREHLLVGVQSMFCEVFVDLNQGLSIWLRFNFESQLDGVYY